MPRLIVEKGADKGKVVRVHKKAAVIIGRDPKASFRLTDALTSRLHVKVEARGDAFWVCDLKSMNGTVLNGAKIDEHPLAFNDKIQIGETWLSFMPDEEKGDAANLVGKTIQGYRVEQRLGRGGMGTVYRAEQTSLKRAVALKILSPELVKDASFIQLFEQEARAAAALNHPNIVQVYDFGHAEGLYFFSMELLMGGSVQDLLSREKRLTPKRAVRIALQTALGLEYAEKKKIVHRDIKPDNLMLGEEEVIKIGDLGLAKSMREGPAAQEEGTILGTPHYVAPEQALGKPVDARVDIYALGATLYRIVAGVTPYSGNTVKEILIRKVKEEPPKLKSIDPELPDGLCALIEKLMAKDPDQRPQSASQILPELEQLRDEMEGRTTTYPVQRDTSMSVAVPPEVARPRRIGTAAAGLLLVMAFAFGGFFMVRDWLTPAPPPDNTGNEPSKDYHELAKVLYEAARAAEPNPAKDDEKSLGEAIARYKSVIQKVGRSEQALTAAKDIKRLEKRLADLRERERVGKREETARPLVTEGLRTLVEARRGFRMNLDMGPVTRAVKGLEKLLADYGDTAMAGQMREALEATREWEKNYVPRIRKAHEVIDKVVEATRAFRFREAFTLLADFEQGGPVPPDLAESIAKAREIVGEAEVGWVRAAMTGIDRQLTDHEFDAAIAKLAEVDATVHSVSQKAVVVKKRKEVEDARNEATVAEQEALRRREKGWIEDAYVEAMIATCKPDYDYPRAVQTLEAALAKVTLPDVKQAAEPVLERFRYERALWIAFLERGEQNAPADKRFKNPILMLPKPDGKPEQLKVDRVTPGQFIIEEKTPRGAAYIGRPFSSVPTESLAAFLVSAWTGSAAETTGAVLFALRRGHDEQALLAQKKLKSSDEREFALVGELCKAGSLQDEEADLLWRWGDARRRTVPEATTRAFKTLREQYAGVASYEKRRTSIDLWLKGK